MNSTLSELLLDIISKFPDTTYTLTYHQLKRIVKSAYDLGFANGSELLHKSADPGITLPPNQVPTPIPTEGPNITDTPFLPPLPDSVPKTTPDSIPNPFYPYPSYPINQPLGPNKPPYPLTWDQVIYNITTDTNPVPNKLTYTTGSSIDPNSVHYSISGTGFNTPTNNTTFSFEDCVTESLRTK